MSLSNFFKLIYNEQIKIYIRKSTWAMYLILAILVIGIGFIEFTFGENETYEMGEQWRIELEKENEQLLKEDEEFERKLAEEIGRASCRERVKSREAEGVVARKR